MQIDTAYRWTECYLMNECIRCYLLQGKLYGITFDATLEVHGFVATLRSVVSALLMSSVHIPTPLDVPVTMSTQQALSDHMDTLLTELCHFSCE